MTSYITLYSQLEGSNVCAEAVSSMLQTDKVKPEPPKALLILQFQRICISTGHFATWQLSCVKVHQHTYNFNKTRHIYGSTVWLCA